MTDHDSPLVLVDDPADGIRRITLNRPEKRNALSNRLRTQLFQAMRDTPSPGWHLAGGGRRGMAQGGGAIP